MKNSSTISFVFLIGLICLTQTTLSEKCIRYLTPLDGTLYELFDCPIVPSTSTNKPNKRQTTPSDNMFAVDFKCYITDSVLCNKVENVFITAGKFISATLNLKNIININATFLNFCDPSTASLLPPIVNCNDPSRIVLGAAGPAVSIPGNDPRDGKTRLFPPALLKQLPFIKGPLDYGPFDITAVFNSAMDYWFEGDKIPMKDRQADMLLVVTHEIIHGLGFTTTWSDNFVNEALTPALSLPNPDPVFVEFVFDKDIILTDGRIPLTSMTDELNKFQIPQGVRTAEQLIQSFIDSPEYPIAKGLFKKAITRNSMVFKTNTNYDFQLETSLVPFQHSSSIGHADFATYANSSDFLMVFKSPKITLGQMMNRAGSTNTTGPIGPNLRNLLQTLGYEVKPTYIPPVFLPSSLEPFTGDPFPSYPGDNYNNDSDDKTSDSSLINFNLSLTLVCIILLTFTRSMIHF